MVENTAPRNLLLALACLSLLPSPAGAELRRATDAAGCTSQTARPLPQIAGVQTASWDDAKITRARGALNSLVGSRQRLLGLMRRLRTSEQSARYAENLGRNGEANYWREDVNRIRPVIEAERARAKPLAAEANVRCSGCTYSDLIAKVRKAIDEAVYIRTAAAEGQTSSLLPRSAGALVECSPKR